MSCKVARIAMAVRESGLKARSPAGVVRRRVQWVALLAFAAALNFAIIASPAHAQAVKGEATLTAATGFARLLLKFQDDVETDVVVAGAILIVRFNKPVDVPVDALADAVPAYVSSVRRDPDGTAVRMALTQKVKVNLMTAGERVYIDLLPEKWTGLPPALPPEVVRELSERALAAERALRLQKTADENKKNPPIRVRASLQPTFLRLVFEVPNGVSVSSSLGANKFLLAFSAPLTFDLADAKITMPSNIKSIDQKIDGDTSRVDIGLVGEVDVHAFREEKNYIVDVSFDQAQKPMPLASQPQLPKIPGAPVAPPADAPVAPVAVKSSAIVPPTSGEIVREAAQGAKSDVKPEATPPATKPEMASQPPTPAAPPATEAAPITAAAAQQDSEAPASVAPAPPMPQQPVNDVPTDRPAQRVSPQVKRTSDSVQLTFPFDASTAAAIFRRADSIWLIFDTDKAIDTKAIEREGGPAIGAVGTIDLPTGRALRISLKRPQLASLSGDERTWTLTLGDSVETPTQPLTAARNNGERGRANVSIFLAKAGQLHRFTDPDAGDTLLVMTAGAPARGFTKRQDFVEFSLLESIQGVVIKPNSDDLTADVTPDQIILSRPGGLTLSSAMISPQRASSGMRAVFDGSEWNENQKADFLPTRNRLMTAAAASTGDRRQAARMSLARFYMARGFYPEAKAVLDLAFSDIKPSEVEPAALVLHSAAATLSGRPEQGLKDLADPAIGNNFDSQLWRALALTRQQKWADARERFKNAELAIASLPVDLQRIVLTDAFRAALEVKDYPGAGTRSNDLDVIGAGPEQPAVTLLRGRLAEALGRDKEALSSYREAVASANPRVSAEAKLLEIALRQKNGEIKDDDALNDLETASVTWRGDAIEVKNLAMLVGMYAAKGRFNEAFAAARTATKLEPNSEASRKVQDQASALFEQVFNGGKGDDLPPVQALAMFYEFSEMTPIGRRGDEMIRRLADRLAAVDLLDQASELLQYQVDQRLEGAARAQVASRLAMLYLMNRKPERAIAALRTTRISDLAGELRQQRLLLEARAQSDVGRHDLALDIVSNVGGREAVRLRSDIYWAARRWRESSEQIELLYGDRWRDFQPLTAAEKSDVIRATVGYSLAEDAVGLARFRDKYGPKMDGKRDKAAFDIASKPASANSADFAVIAKMAASIDTLDGFLIDMKARFPDAIARAKLSPDIKVDPNPTGTLPAIVGAKPVRIVH